MYDFREVSLSNNHKLASQNNVKVSNCWAGSCIVGIDEPICG